jgi:hypothetical protein
MLMNGLKVDTMYGSLRVRTMNEDGQAGQIGFSHDEVVRYP